MHYSTLSAVPQWPAAWTMGPLRQSTGLGRVIRSLVPVLAPDSFGPFVPRDSSVPSFFLSVFVSSIWFCNPSMIPPSLVEILAVVLAVLAFPKSHSLKAGLLVVAAVVQEAVLVPNCHLSPLLTADRHSEASRLRLLE